MTDQGNEIPVETPDVETETPVHIPPIDFSTSTNDPMAGVRKGVGGENRSDD